MKKRIHLRIPKLGAKLAAAFAALSLLPAASASVLMLDFGPTTPTGANLTNSPYHSATSGFADTNWNIFGTTPPAQLNYSDGTTATGLSLTLGASSKSTLVNFALTPASSNALTNNTHSGVFTGNSVGRDGIFNGGVTADKNFVALKLGGLSAGTYDIYVVGANINNSIGNQTTSAFYTAATGDIATFETSGLTPSATMRITSDAAWVEGNTYAKMTVNLAEGEYLILATEGLGDLGAHERRGFLNTVQIVAIPEPSTIAFGLIGGLSLIVLRRRASKRRAA